MPVSTPLATEPRVPLGIALGLIGVVIFGGTLPMMRLALTDLDVMFVTAGRAVLAAIAGIALLAATRSPWPKPREWITLSLIGLALVGGFPFFATLAMVYAPASHGGIVLGVMPLATAVASVLLAGERPNTGFWVCAALGAGLVVAASIRESSDALATGDLALVGAILSASTGYVLSGRLSRTMPGWAVISWALVCSLPVALPLAVWSLPPVPADVPATPWLAFLYLAFMSQFVGFFAWNAGLAIGGIARVGQTQLLQTFVTLGFAAFLLGETIETETVLFAVAVVAIVAIGMRMRVKQR